jgi:hypothetical protein
MDGYPMLSPPNGINWDERREPVAMSGHVLPGIDEKNTSLALHCFFSPSLSFDRFVNGTLPNY